jgi:hypothetical protein
MIYIPNVWLKPCPKQLLLPNWREYIVIDQSFCCFLLSMTTPNVRRSRRIGSGIIETRRMPRDDMIRNFSLASSISTWREFIWLMPSLCHKDWFYNTVSSVQLWINVAWSSFAPSSDSFYGILWFWYWWQFIWSSQLSFVVLFAGWHLGGEEPEFMGQ